MVIDLLAVLEDLDARRCTLTATERSQYRACMVAICALSPAARAAYANWQTDFGDLRTSAAVVLAAVRAEEAAAASSCPPVPPRRDEIPGGQGEQTTTFGWVTTPDLTRTTDDPATNGDQ